MLEVLAPAYADTPPAREKINNSWPVHDFIEPLMRNDAVRATELENAFADTKPMPLSESALFSKYHEFERNRSKLSKALLEVPVSRLYLPESFQVDKDRKVVSDAKRGVGSGEDKYVEYKSAQYIAVLREISATGGWGSKAVGTGKYKVEGVRIQLECTPEEVLDAIRRSQFEIQGLPRN